ncbi:zf-HC2 domain-containing protein [Streptomyces uncialis]|uniref:zf-HC2 domain-containing protein n=1 Tax=Streptomyces uncialis TaxID=1048205 RepID=UPI0038697B4A|nr:zf-HC2 domain-containing protein [Streptomyces uncialis]
MSTRPVNGPGDRPQDGRPGDTPGRGADDGSDDPRGRGGWHGPGDWHVSDRLAARYTGGSITESGAWSVEKHVESCGPCAARVSAAARAGAAGPVLGQVRAALLAEVLADAPEDSRAPGRAHDRRGRRATERLTGRVTDLVRNRLTGRTRSGEAGPGRSREAGTGPNRGVDPARSREAGATRNREASPGRSQEAGATRNREASPGAGPDRGVGPAPNPEADPGRNRRLRGRAVDPGAVRKRHGVALPLPVARLIWAAGPALRGSWAVGVLLVAFGALLLAHGTGLAGDARPLLLAVAPALPPLGVALSYGAAGDPLHEITAATPAGGLRLLLTRTAAVLLLSLPLLTAAGALLPAASGVPGAAAWLLPGLALTTGSLALGSFIGCRRAASLLAGGWLAVAFLPPLLSAPGRTGGLPLPLHATGPAAQAGWTLAALLCAALVVMRRASFDRMEKL